MWECWSWISGFRLLSLGFEVGLGGVGFWASGFMVSTRVSLFSPTSLSSV